VHLHPHGEPRLHRSLLRSGHCYGPVGTVSNIILNTIWYDVNFPAAAENNPVLDVIGPDSLTRLESRSFYGHLSFLQTRYHNLSEHQMHACLLRLADAIERRCTYVAWQWSLISFAPCKYLYPHATRRGSASGDTFFFAEFDNEKEDGAPLFLCQVHEPTPFFLHWTTTFILRAYICAKSYNKDILTRLMIVSFLCNRACPVCVLREVEGARITCAEFPRGKQRGDPWRT
jgi:hypothetical protein